MWELCVIRIPAAALLNRGAVNGFVRRTCVERLNSRGQRRGLHDPRFLLLHGVFAVTDLHETFFFYPEGQVPDSNRTDGGWTQ